MAKSSSRIEHVVVLMLENRSFDNILGFQFGLDMSYSNRNLKGEPIHVWKSEGDAPRDIPDPDPGEKFVDMNYQIFEDFLPAADAEPTMGGFAVNYESQIVRTFEPEYDPRAIMHCFTPDQLPVTSTLARSFGISDRWFASAPCQTWPNRFFLHCATADGYVDNIPPNKIGLIHRFPYDMPTIFNQFPRHRHGGPIPWRIYFHDFPQSAVLSRLWPHLGHFHPIGRFARDVKDGCLPSYSFIEPRYTPNKLTGKMPNDQHPPFDPLWGEQLVAEVYNTLRADEELWTKTLLVVIWDEHGGTWDHVAPGKAPAPDDGRSPKPGNYGFTFDRYGPRVPALFISPYVKAGSVHRAQGPLPFDHTSVIKTLRELFTLEGGPLTRRDAAAPSLLPVLELDPDHLNLGPAEIPVPPSPVGDDGLAAKVEAAAAAPIHGFQESLVHAASLLPQKGKLARLLGFIEGKTHHQPPHLATSHEALPFLQERLSDFLGRDAREE